MDGTGTVLKIEKISMHDGDGLRTVVFLKGCPLKCSWCSTPESQGREIEHGFGRIMTVNEVIAEISKDEIFYFHSDGGVTISGGEPLLQVGFTEAILRESKQRGINTAIETSLYGNFDDVKKLLPYLDTVYADVKHIDSEIHKKFTGVGNELIFDNIKAVSGCFSGNLIIRLPLIQTVNMTSQDAEGIAAFYKELVSVNKFELLPYHRLGIGTYRKLGLPYDFYEEKPPSKKDVDEFEARLSALIKAR